MLCPSCRTANPPEALLCTTCGAPLADRKLVTVLYADLAGHTQIQRGVDPEEWWAFLRSFGGRMQQIIERHGGRVEKYIGDAIFAVFGIPLAREDDAARAVRAAVEMQRAFADLSTGGSRWTFLRELWLRIGLASGEAIAPHGTPQDHLVIGELTNLAGRLQDHAPPGGIILSERTYDLVASLVEVSPLGSLTVKGFPGAQPAFALHAVAEGQGTPRRAALGIPLVDRRLEMIELRKALGELLAGVGKVIAVTGDAGLGKSRLVAELLAEVGPPAIIVPARCSELEQAAAYGVVIQHLRALAGVTDIDPTETRRDQVQRLLQALALVGDDPVQEVLGYLLGLEPPGELRRSSPDIDADELRQLVARALGRIWAAAATRAPVLLVVEDMHWLDAASAEMLRAVLPLTDRAALGLVCASRLHPSSRAWDLLTFARREYHHCYHEVALRPLPPDDTEEMASRLLARVNLPQDLAGVVVRAAEGNPLFLEEMVWSLREAGVDRAVALPATLQGMLQARLDALPEGARRVAQAASVIGRGVPLRLLRAAAGDDGLDDHLTLLQRTEVLVARRRWPEPEFAFKHALLHEATYRTLLREDRRRLHRRVADVMEREGPSGADLSILAHHFREGEEWAKAVDFGERAAAWAWDLGAREQALDLVGQVREILDVRPTEIDPAQQRRIRESLGDLLLSAGRYEEARAQYGLLAALADSPSRRAHAERRLAEAHWRAGDLAWAVEHLRGALSTLPPGEDPIEEAWIHLDLGYVEDLIGRDARSVLAHCARAQELAEGRDPVLNARVFRLLTIAHRHLGDLDVARRSAERALEFAARGEDLLEVAIAHNNLADVLCQQGGIEAAMEHVHLGLEAARRSYRPRAVDHRAILRMTMGELHLSRGAWADAHAALEDGLRILTDVGLRPRISLELLADLAEAMVGEGRPHEAFESLSRCRTLCQTYPLHRFLPKLQRIEAEAHLQGGAFAAAAAAAAEGLAGIVRYGADAERPALLRVRGAVLGRQGEREEAEAALREAAALLSSRPRSPELGRVYLELGRIHLDKADRAQGEAVLGQAREIFASAQATGFLREVEQLLGEAGRPRGVG